MDGDIRSTSPLINRRALERKRRSMSSAHPAATAVFPETRTRPARPRSSTATSSIRAVRSSCGLRERRGTDLPPARLGCKDVGMLDGGDNLKSQHPNVLTGNGGGGVSRTRDLALMRRPL